MTTPTPAAKIELSVSKRQSAPLDGANFVEYLPIKRVKALIKSDLLRIDWVPNRAGIVKEYANEKEQLKQYCKLYDHQLQGFNVKYCKPKHKWGRVLVRDALGCTAFSKQTRNTLINELYYDFDLKNAQPEIIRNICVANDIDCPEVIEYCNNRENILNSIATEINVTPKLAKKLMLRLCFFGTFNGFLEEHGLPSCDEPLFVKNFTKRLMKIAEQTKLANMELYQCARKLKEAKNEKNFIGSFYALFLQEYEFRIIEKLILYLSNETTLLNHPYIQTDKKICIYEYDGIKLLKENVDKFGYDKTIQLLNDKISQLTSFQLCIEEKPIEKIFNIEPWIENVSDTSKRDNDLFDLCDKIERRFDDTGVIEAIAEIHPNKFVFSNSVWYCWNESKWEQGDKALRRAITYDVSKHWFSLLEPFEALYPQSLEDDEGANINCEQLRKIKKSIDTFTKQHLHDNTQINKCVGQGRTLLCDDTIEFDNDQMLFGCNNGILDLREGVFRPARFSDFVTLSCGFDFIPAIEGVKFINEFGDTCEVNETTEQQQFDDVQTMFEQIMPDPELQGLLMRILSTAITGMPIEKFFVFNGQGRNGKGVVDEFMMSLLGDYGCYVNHTVLTENQKNKSSSGSNPEMAKIHKKRFCVTKEPPSSAKIQNSVMKDITGGGEIQARQNYSNNSKVSLWLTLIMEVNVKCRFAEDPTRADAERVVDILFPSFFTDDESQWDAEKYVFPINPALKTTEWRVNHRNIMLNMLFLYALDFIKNGSCIDKYIPNSVKQRSAEYLLQSNDINVIFTSLFEKRDETRLELYLDEKGAVSDADWTLPRIVQKIRNSQGFYDLPKDKRKEYTAEKVKDFFMTNRFFKGAVTKNTKNNAFELTGWRLIPVVSDEPDVST